VRPPHVLEADAKEIAVGLARAASRQSRRVRLDHAAELEIVRADPIVVAEELGKRIGEFGEKRRDGGSRLADDEQAFDFELRQAVTQRRTGDAEPGREVTFGDQLFPRPQHALEDHRLNALGDGVGEARRLESVGHVASLAKGAGPESVARRGRVGAR